MAFASSRCSRAKRLGISAAQVAAPVGRLSEGDGPYRAPHGGTLSGPAQREPSTTNPRRKRPRDCEAVGGGLRNVDLGAGALSRPRRGSFYETPSALK